MQAVLKAHINKTDRNDPRGIAQMMRVGLYRPVHVKTLRSQKLRMLLTHCKLLQSKAIAIENDVRATLRASASRSEWPERTPTRLQRETWKGR
jgi:transposase